MLKHLAADISMTSSTRTSRRIGLFLEGNNQWTLGCDVYLKKRATGTKIHFREIARLLEEEISMILDDFQHSVTEADEKEIKIPLLV